MRDADSANQERERYANVVYPELSYRIMGAIFEVHKTLGPGFVESVYEKALIDEFRRTGLKVEVQKPIILSYKDKQVGKHRLDIVVEGKVVIELKSVARFCAQHQKQLLSYLKASGCKLGILVNFARSRVQYKRVVLT